MLARIFGVLGADFFTALYNREMASQDNSLQVASKDHFSVMKVFTASVTHT